MAKEQRENRVKLGEDFYEDFTSGAKTYLENGVRQYAERLVVEAKNIEKMEHVGDGPAEITAAHVEEAKWVSIRRMRKAASSKWSVVLRIGQIVMAAIVGIGAANFKTWGSILITAGVVIGSILVIIERDTNRGY